MQRVKMEKKTIVIEVLHTWETWGDPRGGTLLLAAERIVTSGYWKNAVIIQMYKGGKCSKKLCKYII